MKKVVLVVKLTFEIPNAVPVANLCTENLQSEIRYSNGPIIREGRLIETATTNVLLGDE